jgi:hypothetical protein
MNKRIATTILVFLFYFLFYICGYSYTKKYINIGAWLIFPDQGITKSEKGDELSILYLDQSDSDYTNDVNAFGPMFGIGIGGSYTIQKEIIFVDIGIKFLGTLGGTTSISKEVNNKSIEEEYSIKRYMLFLPIFIGVNTFISNKTYLYIGLAPIMPVYLHESESYIVKEDGNKSDLKSYSNTFSGFSLKNSYKIGIKRYITPTKYWFIEMVSIFGRMEIKTSEYKYSDADTTSRTKYKLVDITSYVVSFGIGFSI